MPVKTDLVHSHAGAKVCQLQMALGI